MQEVYSGKYFYTCGILWGEFRFDPGFLLFLINKYVDQCHFAVFTVGQVYTCRESALRRLLNMKQGKISY
jgi:hypothetical protein